MKAWQLTDAIVELHEIVRLIVESVLGLLC
jgi:hypothetical protein